MWPFSEHLFTASFYTPCYSKTHFSLYIDVTIHRLPFNSNWFPQPSFESFAPKEGVCVVLVILYFKPFIEQTNISMNLNINVRINGQEQTEKLSCVWDVRGLVTVETGNFPPFPWSFPPAYIDTCLTSIIIWSSIGNSIADLILHWQFQGNLNLLRNLH